VVFTEDYVTIKYNSNGDTLWTQRYNGTGNASDVPFAIAIDNSGNIYVTGYSTGSGSNSDYLTIKYNPNGIQQWIQRYNGAGAGQDVAYSITADDSGNVYITGVSDTASTGGSGNCVTIKYNTNGVQQWIKMYSGAGNLRDLGNDITLDNSGNIYVTGYTTLSANDINYLTIKYNSNGAMQWVKTYNGTGNDRDIALNIEHDNNGNVYITGLSRSSNSFYSEDFVTIKYDSSGTEKWTKRYNSPNNYGDEPQDMAVDVAGNVYVTGYGFNGGTYSLATVKYSASGNEEWVKNYAGVAYAYGMTLDNSGNIYITGALNLNSDCFLIKYDPQGLQQFVQVYDGLYTNVGLFVKTNNLGDVFVAGNTSEIHASNSNSDFMLIKYSPVPVFQAQFKRNNIGKAILDNLSTYDTIFVNYTMPAGFSVMDVNIKLDTVLHTNDSDLEIYLIHNGITDTVIYLTGGTGDNFINTVLNDSSSNPINSGTAPFSGSFRPIRPLSQFNNSDVNGAWILKIHDRQTGNTGTIKAWSLVFTIQNNTIGLQNISNEIPSGYTLLQNYPNPFNPVTKISFAIPKASYVKLIVYDMLGREIETLVNENLNAGTYNADWSASAYPSGVYFYKLESESFVLTRKMILIK
jgi:uncharacterized delta-60 repeat protein